MKIAVVCSRFNRPVTEKLQNGAVETLLARGLSEDQIEVLTVPGAVEIPLAVKAFLEAGFDGVVALGAVIRGETTHYDYVCSSVERGCTELQLQYMRPVGFGILTTEDGEQAMARSGGSKGNKGAETAEVVLEMLESLKKIKSN